VGGVSSRGSLYFDDLSTGGTARISMDYGGVLDITQHNGAMTLGALSGRGSIRLGDNDLLVGAGNQSMLLSLLGLSAGSGRLHKIGSGTLTIDNYSYDTRELYLDGGTLQIPYWLDLEIHQASGTMLKVGNTGGLSHIGGLTGAGTLQLDGLGLSIGTNNRSTTYTGAMQGTASLTKVGYGTFSFTGTANYTGATNVNSGTFQLNGSLGGSGVTVAGGATLRGLGTITSSVTVQGDGRLSIGLPASAGSLTVGSLLLNERSLVDLRVGSSGDVINVLGNLRLDGVLNILNAGMLDAGTFRLMTYGGTLTDNGVTFATPPGFQPGDFSLQTSVPGQVNLIVLSGVNILYWDGANVSANGAVDGGSGSWNNRTSNWTTGNGSMNANWSPRAAAFSGAAGTVNVTDNVSVSGLQFLTSGYTLGAGGGSIDLTGAANANTAAGVDATIATPLTGNGSLRKTGEGTLTLGGTNSYSGGTRVEEGALVVRTVNGSGLGSGPVAVLSSTSARLRFAGSASAGMAAITVNGSIISAQTAALEFTDSTTAGSATISNEGNAALGGFGGATTFSDNARAGNATISNRGPNFQYPYYSQTNIPGDGQTTFRGSSSADAAVINNFGGHTDFAENASAGSALINNVLGGASFSGNASAAMSVINNGIPTSGSVPSVGWTDFRGNSSAGSASVTNQGGIFSYQNGFVVFGSTGATSFYDTSTAGNATFHNLIVTNGGSEGGRVVFRSSSRGGTATFVSEGAASVGGYGAPVYFLDNSNAERATIINHGKTNADANTGGRAIFWNTASAGQATITNEGSAFGDRVSSGNPSFGGGYAWFSDTTSADHATIRNMPALAVDGRGGVTLFSGSSSAGSATILNDGSAVAGEMASGLTTFSSRSSAGNATITNGAGSGGMGGRSVLLDSASGGTSRIITEAGGAFDISGLATSGTTVGAISGAGSYVLGSRRLTIVGHISSASENVFEVSGGMSGIGGSLELTAPHTLIFSGANTYTGATIVSGAGAALQVDGSLASSSVVVQNGGELTGRGVALGDVEIGATTGASAILSPGASGIGTFTIGGALSLESTAVFRLEINSDTLMADRILANGVTLENGATLFALDLGATLLGPGLTFTVLENTSLEATVGTFSGLGEGAQLTIGSNQFAISYRGGNGNDITLTSAAVPEPSTVLLLLSGAAAGVWLRRRRRR
jgi:autotransporter-associated beta strand protein